MKLYYFRGPNFGDELNEYLLPKVFPNFFDDDASILFLGIGSILYDYHPRQAKKIVFGAGFGKYTSPPVIDSTWNIYCVRGPRTAAVLGIDKNLVAADSAILIKKFRLQNRVLRHKFSFIPHWESLTIGHWESVAQEAGVNFIDPRWPVERVLTEIESSEVLIAEAMHGAITADALRVPWIPLTPVEPKHRFKWYDWAEALEIPLMPQHLAPSSVQEGLSGWLGASRARWPVRAIRLLGAERLLDFPFKIAARNSLFKAKLAEPTLSSDAALDRAIDKLESSVLSIRRDFP